MIHTPAFARVRPPFGDSFPQSLMFNSCPLMGWSGRVPAPLASKAGLGLHSKGRAMPNPASNQIAIIGIDIGKNSFHIVGLDKRGAIVLRQKWSRGQVEARLANMPSCLIGMKPASARIASAAS